MKLAKTFENVRKYSKNEWKRLHSTGENIRRMIDFPTPTPVALREMQKKRPTKLSTDLVSTRQPVINVFFRLVDSLVFKVEFH